MQIKQIDLKKELKTPDPDDLITTTKGLIRAGDLERRVMQFENQEHLTYAIEYWDGGEKEIHRSVHVQLKHSTAASSIAASF